VTEPASTNVTLLPADEPGEDDDRKHDPSRRDRTRVE